MRRIAASGWLMTLAVVASWRAASELLLRRRELAASGELERRIAARRELRVSRVLEDLGLVPARARTRVPVVVAVPGGPAANRAALDRAVHVGYVAGDLDHDDVGLLEGAMRRAARERMGVGGVRIERRPPDRTDWVQVLADANYDPGATAGEDVGDEGAGIAPWWMAVVAAGVALTVAPLVRPLEGAAPWLALAGVALALVGWLGARRR